MTETYAHAKAIVSKLKMAGYTAYFAGGWVRDYVMGHPSEDIDIATDAPSSKIMDLFPQTVLVGLAFGVVIVVLDGHQFEVATFRKDLHYTDGRHPTGIEMSTPKEDALRRDFTINGMFYDPLEEVIHDFVHGQEDIRLGVIRTIGDPYERFFEDRLRMLRAFRFAARFSFTIDPETQEAIRQTSDKLFPAVAMERVWQEFNKMAAYPRFDQAIIDMHHLALLEVIFPELAGIHMKDLHHWVKSYAHFPKNCSTILFLMELFPKHTLERKLEIAARLKASNRDFKTIEFMDELTLAVEAEESGIGFDPVQWVKLYSQPHYDIAIQVIAARHPEHDRARLLSKYIARMKKLSPHIQRYQAGAPLVSSAVLKEHGIMPGKRMGLLLKEAERIAIQENLHDARAVLEKLSSMPLWKEDR